MILGLAIAALGLVALVFVLRIPTHDMRREERELRAFNRRKDAAERRGEIYPPAMTERERAELRAHLADEGR